MKTAKLLLLIITICFVQLVSAQRFYVGVGCGYGFSANKITDDNTVGTSTFTSYTTQVENNSFSYGRGVIPQMYFGYFLSPHVSVEFGAGYLLGATHISTYDYTSAYGDTQNDKHTYKATMFRLVPAIRFTVGEGKLKAYMKSGMIAGLGAQIIVQMESKTFSGSSATVELMEHKFNKGLSFGFQGALGCNYSINEKMGLFIEFAANLQSWAMKFGKITKYTVNGINQLPFMTVSEKEVEFLSDYTQSTLSPTSEPDKTEKQYMSFSSYGFNIGLNISIGK